MQKIIILVVLAALAAAFFIFDLGSYLTLEQLQANRGRLEEYYQHYSWQMSLGYFLAYVTMAAVSLPGAAVLTLAGGALFGLWWGLALVSFASSLGATLAFLVARTILGKQMQEKYASTLTKVNQGLERDGAFYLFSLRLVPLFPFFVINLVMGLTKMRTLTFYVVSQIGMLPGTFVFVNAGTALSTIESLGDVVSPEVLISFALLGIFPLCAKLIINFVQKKKGGA